MKPILFVLFMLSSSLNPILSQPNLLERAKNNPSEGSKLCKKFREYNAENKPANKAFLKTSLFIFIIKRFINSS